MDDRQQYYGNEEHGVLVPYLRGERPDWQGRWQKDVLTWNDTKLEDDHQYIQWLFPLDTESAAVQAPRLRDFEVAELEQDEELHEVLLGSLDRMMGFYGFAHDDSGWERIKNFDDRAEVWLHPKNHNYLRISRILGSLALATLYDAADSVLTALEDLYATKEGNRAIDSVSMAFWRERAKKP